MVEYDRSSGLLGDFMASCDDEDYAAEYFRQLEASTNRVANGFLQVGWGGEGG